MEGVCGVIVSKSVNLMSWDAKINGLDVTTLLYYAGNVKYAKQQVSISQIIEILEVQFLARWRRK